MDRFLIVDGMNLLFQMFYGMPSRIIGKHGKSVHGTLGFVGALIKTARRILPTHVVVVFDGEHHNPRTDLDPEYKANRPDWSAMPEDELPFSSLPDVYAALDYLGIKHFETTDTECDDVIAAYVKKYSESTDVTVMSQDSDFFQLIGDNVRVLRYRGDASVLCDSEYVKQKYGVPPEKYAEWKSLVGDSSDNVRGVPHVGIKTAARLISQFGGVGEILSKAHEIERTAVRDSILASRERIEKNLALITLDGTAEIPYPISSLSYSPTPYGTTAVLAGIGVL